MYSLSVNFLSNSFSNPGSNRKMSVVSNMYEEKEALVVLELHAQRIACENLPNKNGWYMSNSILYNRGSNVFHSFKVLVIQINFSVDFGTDPDFWKVCTQ